MRRFDNGTAMARDSVPPPGMSVQEYAARLRKLNPTMQIIPNVKRGYVHMEPR